MQILGMQADLCPRSGHIRSTPPGFGQLRVDVGRNGADTRARAIVPTFGATSNNLGHFGAESAKFGPSSTDVWSNSANVDQMWFDFDHDQTCPEFDQTWSGLSHKCGLESSLCCPNSAATGSILASTDQSWPGIDQNWSNIGQACPNFDRPAKLDRNMPRIGQLGPKSTNVGPSLAKFGPLGEAEP